MNHCIVTMPWSVNFEWLIIDCVQKKLKTPNQLLGPLIRVKFRLTHQNFLINRNLTDQKEFILALN